MTLDLYDYDYRATVYVGTPAQQFDHVKVSANYDSFIIGQRTCTSCGKFNDGYDPAKSTSSGPPQVTDLNPLPVTPYGSVSVKYYSDTVCLDSKTLCAKNFIFQGATKGNSQFEKIGGLIGIAPNSKTGILAQLYN